MEKKIVGIGSFYKDVFAHKNKTYEQRTYLRVEDYWRVDRLVEAIEELNYKYETVDKINEKIDYLIMFDTPKIKKLKFLEKYITKETKKILIASECEMIRPDNYSSETQIYYDKILTWDDNLIDGKKYIKSNTFYIDNKFKFEESSRKEFVLIAGNKKCWHPNELYSERKKIVEWFSENHPEKLDLFGPCWDLYSHPMNKKPFLYLNNKIFNTINKIMGSAPIVWKGVIDSKLETLKNYTFTFALENAKNYNGYILEKIFDPMSAGSIPIYLGATNIKKYIPKECFIDYSEFKSIKELYNYCMNLTKQEIDEYQSSIRQFLQSNDLEIFQEQYFKKQIKELIS